MQERIEGRKERRGIYSQVSKYSLADDNYYYTHTILQWKATKAKNNKARHGCTT